MAMIDIFCGSLGRSLASDDTRTRIILSGPGANAVLNLEHIRKPLLADLPGRFHDLIEIASYVYVADQLTNRQGKRDGSDHGKQWRRPFHFHIPVRDPNFWTDEPVMTALVSTLGFLSDDEYTFTFTKDTEPTAVETYLQLEDFQPWGEVDDVVLFSGGLDSLAGALEQILQHRQRLIMVTHASCPKYETWHKVLRDQISQRAGDHQPLYIRVSASKVGQESAEYTQRSRSFLYAALATTVAAMVKKSRIRFFENGVTSLNLPINGQIIGARATRTTHPDTLRRLSGLFSLIAERDFLVENPFQWRTKTDIVRSIVDLRCQAMIENATSCAHTWIQTRQVSHCGTCSQCVDRRLATIAAGAMDYDREDIYRTNLFTQALRDQKTTRDRTMVGSYAQTAARWARMNEVQLLVSEGELGQVLAALPGSPSENAKRVVDLIHRHAKQVQEAIKAGISRYNNDLVDRAIDADAFIHMVVGRERWIPDTKPASAPTTKEDSRRTFSSSNWFKPVANSFVIKRGIDGPVIIPNLAGMQIIRHALSQPGISISCQAMARLLYEQHAHLLMRKEGALAKQVEIIDDHDREVAQWEAEHGNGEDGGSELHAEMAIEMIDEDNIKLVRGEINDRKEELRTTSNAARRAALEREIAQAEAYLRRATRPGRPETPKRVNTARKKLVDAISRNLKTTLKAIHKASPTLATFFSTPQKGGFLSTGSQIRFDPPMDARDWDITEATTAEILQQDAVIS